MHEAYTSKRRTLLLSRVAMSALAVGITGSLVASEAAEKTQAQSPNDQRTAAWGILDVTKAPFNADPSGKTDSTKAIQKAVDDARDRRMIAFFPAGNYRVSDTIIGNQQSHEKLAHPRLHRRDDYPCFLLGDTRGGRRARLALVDNAPEFQDPARPKAVVHFISFDKDGKVVNPNISANQVFASIDVDLGRGNAGAIGVDQQGAQGCVAEDVHVEAAGAFAGFRGASGSGGSMTHLSVNGGRYGVYLAALTPPKFYGGSQPVATISFVTLIGQTEKSVVSATRGPLTLVGAEIEGPGIHLEGATNPFDGALNVVDSVIRYRGKGPVITGNRPVYLENVFVENAPQIARLDKNPVLEGASQGWTHVIHYAATPMPIYTIWCDGAKQLTPVADVRQGEQPPTDFRRAHQWTDKLPCWQNASVANVMEPPYSAKGDDSTDDTDVLQRALDEHRDVFIPKGFFRVSRSLRLRADSRLFGLGVHSKIEPLPEAPAFADPAKPSPLLITPDDAEATCMVAFLQLGCRFAGSYAMHWQAGRHSISRNVRTCIFPWEQPKAPADHPEIIIDGHGGGRWYNAMIHEGVPQTKNHRHVLARGTQEPLAFYMLNLEHSQADYMAEFEDVRNLRVYGLKAETISHRPTPERTIMLLRNSSDFRFFGYGGNASAPAGQGLYRIENSSDFVLANFSCQIRSAQYLPVATAPSKWFIVEEKRPEGETVKTPATEFFTVYSRK